MKNMKLKYDEKGSAIISFVIVFPVVLLITLGVMQIALLFTAKQLINYAAFTSNRTGIVWINFDNVNYDIVFDKIKKSACIVLASISPAVNEPITNSEIDSNSLDLYRNGLSENFYERYEMAKKLTTIKIIDPTTNSSPEIPFITSKDIQVEVTYQCPLIIPLVNFIISKSYQLLNNNTIINCNENIPKLRLPISAKCTLQVEGEINYKKD